MSNFMSDCVLKEKIGADVWKDIVFRYTRTCRVTGNIPESKAKLAKMVEEETKNAREEFSMRPFIPSQTDAERARETQELEELLQTARGNVLKNYLPVIMRAEKDGIPLLDNLGIPKGKSRLEAEYKAKEELEEASDTKAEKDPQEVAEGLFKTFKAYCVKHSVDADAIINL